MSELGVKQYIESLPDNQPGVALELGANHGIFTDLIASKFERCYAFECDPTNIEILTNNVHKSNVSIVPKAVGIVNGKSRLFKCPPNMGGHSMVEDYAKHGMWGHSLNNFIWVPTITLDSFVNQEEKALNIVPDNNIKFIKCDIEGAESFVFDYAKNLFTNNKLTMIIEIHTLSDHQKLYDLFTKQYGYKVFYIGGRDGDQLSGQPADKFENDVHYRVTNE